MKIDIVGNEETGWELIYGEDQEPIGVAEKMSYLSAIDAFAANWPEYMVELDELRATYVDFVGEPVVEKKRRVSSPSGQPREKKRGSEARIRELILAGESSVECLRIVREEFPESNATLSNVAWNRSELRKNLGGYLSNGQKA